MDCLAPEPRCLKHIGLVYAREMSFSLAGCLEGAPCNTLDLHYTVCFGVKSSIAGLIPAALTEIYTACQLSYYHQVKTLCGNIRPQHACSCECRLDRCRSQIGIQSESLAQSEQCLFRAHVVRNAVPFRSAYCSEKNTVRCKASVDRLLRQRNAVFIKRSASCKICRALEFVSELLARDLKCFYCSAYYFRSYPVSRDQRDIVFHVLLLLYVLKSITSFP